MCTKTGIKDEYQNWDQACVPGGPGGVPPASCDRHRRHGRACEVHAVGVGLKLVYILKDYGLMADKFTFILLSNSHALLPHPPPAPSFHKPPQNSSPLFCNFLYNSFIIIQHVRLANKLCKQPGAHVPPPLLCFLPSSYLLTTSCKGKIIYSAISNDFYAFS